MALIDMKRAKQKATKGDKAVYMGEYEQYAYGLRVNLSKPEFEKLGMKVSDFKVGETLNLVATVEVIATREAAGKNVDDYSTNVELQITAMDLGEAKKSALSKFNEQNQKGPGE